MAEVTTPIITDTTGQSIASAITALGSTLGANKADINGANIVNPSVFRQAIRASGLSYDWFTKSNLGKLVSNTDYIVTFDVSKTGFIPMGIIQFRLLGSYSSWFHASQWNISNNTATVVIRADASGVSSNNLIVGIGVLYANNLY